MEAEEGEEDKDTITVINKENCTHDGLELVLSKVEAWTWGNYNVTDASTGDLLYKIEGRLSLRWTRTILDSSGRKILRLHKKMLSPNVLDAFVDTDEGAKRVFLVRSALSCPAPHFSLNIFLPANESTTVSDFKLEGTYFQNEYSVLCGDQLIAQAKRKPDASSFVLGCGAYTIMILPRVDHVFVIALVLLMDEIILEASVVRDRG